MLALLAEKVSQQGLSLENVSTELRMGQGGRRDFVVDADCTTPILLDHEHLQEVVNDLGSIKSILNLDVLDVRVHKQRTAK